MPSFVPLMLAAMVHVVALVLWASAESVLPSNQDQADPIAVVISQPEEELLSEGSAESKEEDSISSLPESVIEQDQPPPVDYRGIPKSKPEADDIAESPVREELTEAGSVAESFEGTNASDGQYSSELDASGLSAARLRLVGLDSRLINLLINAGHARIVLTDSKAQTFVLMGSLNAPSDLSPITEFHQTRLSPRAIQVPSKMAISLTAFLRRNWGYSSVDIKSLALHFSSTFDRYILAQQQAAVAKKNIPPESAVTICRINTVQGKIGVEVIRVKNAALPE